MTLTPNRVLIIEQKFGRTVLTSNLCLSKKIQVTRVQSSMNETNYLAPVMLGIGEGPQMSLCMRQKRIELLLLLTGKDTCLCLAS